MAKIAFIGLGHMGGGMAPNLVKAGHEVCAFDLSEEALAHAVECGCLRAGSTEEAVADAEAVITMLPAGRHVQQVFLADTGVLAAADPQALLIDCSTIDVATARLVAQAAGSKGIGMIDAPVSGGVAGAAAGTLTFMVGGEEEAFRRAEPILRSMGRNVVHAGGSGNGQAAKICNNMILGISMIAVSEAFVLAAKLGLDAGELYDVASAASGQCWSLTTYCPVPGVGPASPADNGYKPGFATSLMLKDLALARQAAEETGAATPLGAHAERLYRQFNEAGGATQDFSAIIRHLAASSRE